MRSSDICSTVATGQMQRGRARRTGNRRPCSSSKPNAIAEYKLDDRIEASWPRKASNPNTAAPAADARNFRFDVGVAATAVVPACNAAASEKLENAQGQAGAIGRAGNSVGRIGAAPGNRQRHEHQARKHRRRSRSAGEMQQIQKIQPAVPAMGINDAQHYSIAILGGLGRVRLDLLRHRLHGIPQSSAQRTRPGGRRPRHPRRRHAARRSSAAGRSTRITRSSPSSPSRSTACARS